MTPKNLLKALVLAVLTVNSSVAFSNNSHTPENLIKRDSTMKIQHYTEVVDNYIRFLNEKNLEGILSLFADNGSVEDPVGSKIISGKAGLREFYSGAVNIDLKLKRTGPVRVAGMEAAFPFQLLMEVNSIPTITDIIDVFRFDEEGKIVQMRAFWGPVNQRQATE
ncbi:MAG TPA: hypothetical protein DCL86_16415 [Bacteroidales bacterium]|nr:hypothetical protein [Bacteroidales bacterium]